MSIDIKILQSSCCGSGSSIKEELQEAAYKAGVEVDIREINEINELIKFGTMTFPALVIDGDVHDYRNFRSSDDIAALLSTIKSSVL